MVWILLSVFAGICNGTFALPMKFTPKWRWENIWSLFTVWGFVVFPFLLAVLSVPDLSRIFLEVDSTTVLFVFLFGFMWGIGSICFGLAISYIGIGLAFSINIGLTIVIGSLLPLIPGVIKSTPDTKNIIIVVVGVLVILAGVIINGYSAVLRERDRSKNNTGSINKSLRKNATKGILLCVGAGLLSPMLQVAFIYGNEIIKVAVGLGVNPAMAPNAVWMVALSGGFVINLFYTGYLIIKNSSWTLFRIREAKKYHWQAVLMGFLWIVTIACYGISVSNMGELGLSVGWAIFNSVGIVCANLIGVLTKEWKDIPRKTFMTMIIGTVILVLGTFIVGWVSF